eukprot:GHUV01037074.1.p1 GENE.GHUV01037074.1~~GHUV01037074.1.p1  ORF type:complete len:141 (-),score=12.39 GHUV01037074.1:185-607(-)
MASESTGHAYVLVHPKDPIPVSTCTLWPQDPQHTCQIYHESGNHHTTAHPNKSVLCWPFAFRNLLGIPMSGDPSLQHLMSIHFTWPALGQALLSSGRAGMLYFVFNRQVVAVVVAHDLSRGECVAQVRRATASRQVSAGA